MLLPGLMNKEQRGGGGSAALCLSAVISPKILSMVLGNGILSDGRNGCHFVRSFQMYIESVCVTEGGRRNERLENKFKEKVQLCQP